MNSRTLWVLVKQGVLWLGLLICGYALWHTRDSDATAFYELGGVSWILVAVLLLVIWALLVTAWRLYLLAYTGRSPEWSTAMRQQGLLLVGKYVPGGVFGFLARIYDEPHMPRKQLLWAGLTEQVVSVALSVAIGGVLYLVATRQSLGWLSLLLPLPFLAAVGAELLHRFAARLRWMGLHADDTLPDWKRLLNATSIQLLQLLAWVVLVAILAQQLFDIDGWAGLGVAGAFLLAVAMGIVVLIVPGGIGVRELTVIALSSLWLGSAEAFFLAASMRLLSTLLDGFSGVLAAMSSLGKETGGQGG